MGRVRCIFGIVLLLQVLKIQSSAIHIEGFLPNKASHSAVDEFTYHEVTVPHIRSRRSIRDTSTLVGNEHVEETTIVLAVFNKSFVLDLKLNKDLFSPRYIEKTRTKEEPVVKNIKNIKDHKLNHCYYHGNVRGMPDSVVAISTCSGLSGLINSGKEQYYIVPVAGSTGYQHVVYRASDMKEKNFKCGTDDHSTHTAHFPKLKKRNSHRHPRSLHGPYDSNKKTRYVELYLVNDLRQFYDLGQNETTVIQRSKDIANIVNSLYHSLNIYVALVGVEVWTAMDEIEVLPDADKTLNNFLTYRRTRINPYHPNDNAHLITGHSFDDGVVGKALKQPICTFRFSGGVNMDHSRLVGPVGTTVAHEMGHNFGMEHDRKECKCPDDRCIMAATSGGVNPTQWSSCSKKQLQDAFDIGMDYCLRNKPEKLFNGPVCGNGFVEKGEECDCGLPEECTTKCCDAATCKLNTLVNATCATGKCCNLDTCHIKAATTPCRQAEGECDLPEFCNGTSEYCPADVALMNGNTCRSGEGYCYNGTCKTQNDQCKLLWGSTGKVSNNICFSHLNTRGTAHGNCGYNWTKDEYYACKEEDVQCGMLHCEHKNEKLMFWRESLARLVPYTFLDINNTRYICRSAILDVGLSDQDPGMTQDGTKCGDEKMCVNRKCRSFDDLGFTPSSCSSKCNGHGVCNQKGNCHCDNGWAPPSCDKSGFGGSIDSGPASYETSDSSLLAGMLVLFLVILPLLGIGMFFAYRYRETLKMWWNKRKGIKYAYRQRAPSTSPPPPPVNKPRPAPVRPQSPMSVPSPTIVKEEKEVANNVKVNISHPVLQSTTNRTPSFKQAQFIDKPKVVVRPTVYANVPDSDSDDDFCDTQALKKVPPPRPLSPPQKTESAVNKSARKGLPPVKPLQPPNRGSDDAKLKNGPVATPRVKFQIGNNNNSNISSSPLKPLQSKPLQKCAGTNKHPTQVVAPYEDKDEVQLDPSTGEPVYEVIPGEEEEETEKRDNRANSAKQIAQTQNNTNKKIPKKPLPNRPPPTRFSRQDSDPMNSVMENPTYEPVADEDELPQSSSLIKDRIAKLNQNSNSFGSPQNRASLTRSQSSAAANKPSLPPKPKTRPGSVANC